LIGRLALIIGSHLWIRDSSR